MTLLRAGLCVTIAFAVAAHGAVEPWSEAVLVVTAALLLLLWGLQALRRRRMELVWNPLLVPLLAFGALAAAQWVLGLTVHPYLTKIELLKLAAYLLLFFVAVQVWRSPAEARGLVWFLLVLGFAAALVGIVQHFTFNGKLYWVRELRYGGIPFGPYVNRNHFAGLMELIVPLGAALLLLRGVRRDQLPLLALFTVVPIGAVALSASRGGVVSLSFQLLLLVLLTWLTTRGSASFSRRTLLAAVAGLALLGGFLLWLDVGQAIAGRFGEIRAEEVSRDRRVVMTRDTWRIFLDHPVVGTGVGTLVIVYPRYESFYDGKVVDHAHNDYVELLAETGLLGGLAALAFLALLFTRALRRLAPPALSASEGFAAPENLRIAPWALAVRLGAVVACLGPLLHSLVDFNLRLPSHAVLFLVLAAVATSAERSPHFVRRE